MAFSCMTVIGSARKEDVTIEALQYDSVDDAIISAEQGATIILNYLDSQVLADMDVLDLSILGKIDLTSVDGLLSSIYDLLTNSTVGFVAVSVSDLKNLTNGADHLKDVRRSGGDLNVVYALLNFLGDDDVVSVVKKAPNGLLIDGGITLGWLNGIVAGLVDLSSINDILTDIPGFATRAVFDMLIYGSYGYDKDAEDLGNVLPAEVDTIDEILTQAITGLLMSPQDYEWSGTGDAAVKVWDMDSKVMPTIAAYDAATVRSYFSISDGSNSIFALLDKLAPFAIYDLGIQPLNNNLKKALMEAVEADVNEISLDKVPADAQAAFELDQEVGKESYVTYISYDKIFHSEEDGEWYYTTLGNKTILGDDNLPVLDDEGNEKTEKVREFYKINMAAANEFADLINWDWNITAPVPLQAGTGEINEIDYAAIIGKYGSIAQSLNHLVYIVFNNALTEDAIADFEATTGAAWLDGATSADAGNGKTVFVDNIERLLKYLLANYADKIFGEDSEYVDWEYADVADMKIVELIAHIGPTFFEDVMPQLIIPKNEEGRAAFHNGVQIVEFGALVIREFMTEIAPQVNYDSYIFAEGTLTSDTGRQFAEHTADEWVNIILNMGMDIAVTYLTNLTNFNDFCKKSFGEGFNVSDYILESATDEANILGDARWKLILDNVILWAVEYVGTADRTGGVLNGINYNSVYAVDGPLNKLSFILNKILPLGFVNGCTSASYDLDVQMLFDRLMDLVKNFNLDALVGLFGRNTASSYNLFTTAPLVQGVLDLVNRILALVLRTNLLPVTSSVSGLLTNANLSTIIATLLNALESIKVELLTSALPVVCKLVKLFGGEQEMGTPKISLGSTVVANGGAASGLTFTVTNGSTGLWRGYRDASGNLSKDNHYTYDIKSIKAYNYDGSASGYITGLGADKTRVDYGDKAIVTFNVANVTGAGVVQKIEVTYGVNNEELVSMGDNFKVSKYIWISTNPSDEGEYHEETYKIAGKEMKIRVRQSVFVNNYEPALEETINNTDVASASKPGTTFGYKVGAYCEQTQNGVYVGQTPGWDDSSSSERNDTMYLQVVDLAAAKAFAKNPGANMTFNVQYKASTNKGSGNMKITFFDGENVANLSGIVGTEAGKMRKAAEYNTAAGTYSYADRLLRTSDWNEDQLKETTSTMTAWIDADENEYAESAVSDIEIAKDANGNVTGKSGFVTVDGKEVAVKFVTKLDNGTVWSNYTAALQAGIQGAWQVWNEESIFDHKARYDALRIASTEVDFIKLSDEELALLGDNIDASVLELEAVLDASEATYSDDKDYTDYRMYRWNRYNDAREEARDIINAYYSTQRTSDDLNKYFPYASIYPSDLAKLVKGDKYENYINALLEDFDDGTKARNAQDLENAKIHYSGYEAIDVAQAENLVTRMGPRLLTRDHDVIDTHLRNEVASAKAMITDSSLYTERSWVKYEAALAAAEELLADSGKTQMKIFDTKWELLTCRNELVFVEDEADYSELEALIAQAETALENAGLYDNTNKEFGQVLAELGYHDFDGTQLFYGSALWANAEPYDYNDQDIIDDAADALKEALARLKFKGLTITDANGNVNTSTGILSTDNADTPEVEETITATIATIAAEMNADAVKDLFKVTANNATVGKENITVSNDLYYTIDTDLPGFAGTNSVVTFYTVQGDVKIPVATVKIVVEADINGDGAVDVLDAAYENLVQTEKTKLEGCYLLAGDLFGSDRKITADDYSAVVNAVKDTAA